MILALIILYIIGWMALSVVLITELFDEFGKVGVVVCILAALFWPVIIAARLIRKVLK